MDQTGSDMPRNSEAAENALPHLPSSNLEVRIRTLSSDVESLSRGGGLLGIEEKISISLPEAISFPSAPVTTENPVSPSSNKKFVIYAVLGLGGVLLLFSLGYFIPKLFAPKSGAPAERSVGSLPPSVPAQKPTSSAPSALAINHRSFLNVPADTSVSVSISPLATSSVRDQWYAGLRFASGTIAEALPKDQNGNSLDFAGFLSAMDIKFNSADLIAGNFNNDFTAFVYRDSSGYWPGYILKLKADSSPLLLQAGIRKIENETDFINSAFAVPVGGSLGGFEDAQLLGQPVRELSFGKKPAVFVYGWFHSSYLVIGTSEGAVSAAVSRL